MINLQELSTNKLSQNEANAFSSNKERVATLVNISSSLFYKIIEFTKKNNANISDIFLLALKLLIYKYTDSDSITIGYLSNNLADIILLSSKIDANDTCSSLFKKNVIEVTDALKSNSVANFSSLAASLQIQNEIEELLWSDQLALTDLSGAACLEIDSNFHLKILRKEDSCSILINFDGSLLQKWQVDSYIGSYQHILELITDEKYLHTAIKTIEMLALPEQHILLKDWNGGKAGFSIDKYGRIEEAFTTICKLRGDKIAIHTQDRDYTYSEINVWSDNFAKVLAQSVHSDLIAIAMEKSIDLIVATIAAFKANLTYLPIDPKYPASRIQYMLEDSKCNTLLTNINIVDLNLDNSIKLLFFKELNYIPDKQPLDRMGKKDNPIACILYTSGSTGNPKPVMVPHKGITNLIYNQLKYFKISDKDRLLLFSSISFDSSIAETWLSLLSGAALVIPHDKYLAGELLAQTILDKDISFLIIPPSILDTMPNASRVGRSLKTVISVGEALTTATVEKWRPNLNNLINAYGPSEASVCTTFYLYDKDIANNIIGKPLDGAKVYVLNSDHSLSPIGCIGELYIGGLGLSPGYYRHAELDQERFITNPYNSEEKIYKTGDLVRWLHDGNLQYLGRIDRQVKFNGVRIELEEIENQLSSHPMVNLCAVVMEDNESNHEKSLLAYFTVNPDVVPDSNLQQTIRAYLLNKLPPSIVPQKYILLEEFPRLPNGKIDHSKLNRSSYENTQAIPQNTIVNIFSDRQQKIAAIYAQVLKLDIQQIIPEADFFSLGASSLHAINALALINKEFESSLSLEDFFAQSSINDLIPILFDTSSKTDDIAIDQEHFLEDDLFFDLESITSNTGNSISKPVDLVENILITGSSGFLGGYLLNSLLKNFQNATIYCLVRGNDIAQKLQKSLEKYHLNNIDFNRIKLYPADIAKPNLGLTTADYDNLAKNIDSIYHCAAAVNHIYNYGLLRSANVLGTMEIIKLASTLKKKQIHFISALDVSMLQHHCQNFSEEKIRAQNAIGYIQTKWVSEYLLEKASSLLGLPVRVYRPGNIIGDLKQGIMEPTTNHFSMFTKGCLQLGYGPNCNFLIEMTPVDMISESIVKLSMRVTSKQFLVYKLHNPHYTSWNEYTDMLTQLGYKLALIDVSEWINTHLAHINSENALFLLKNYYIYNGVRMNVGLKEISNDETLQALNEVSLSFPNDYLSIVPAYVNQLREIKFL